MSAGPVLFVLGTSQAVASTGLRERLQVDVDEVFRALLPLLGGGHIQEAIPLATCGRLELYGVAPDPDRVLRLLRQLMARRSGLPIERIATHSYVHSGRAAVRHLFRVAAGLDSVIHGEAQIIGQVRDALEHPGTRQTAGPVLQRAFQSALAAGKLVRTKTSIGRGAVSVAGAAVGLLQRETGSLENRSAVVLGAGATGSLIGHLLRKAGIGRLTVANRTPERARLLAAELGAESCGLAALTPVIAGAEIVVGTVSHQPGLIAAGSLAEAFRTNPRSRYFLDLAHPRNFDVSIDALPGVRLIDLEQVFRSVESARRARKMEVPQAEAIVDEAVEAYVTWYRGRASVAMIRAVRARVLEMAETEVERHARGLSGQDRERMLGFARSLARSLLHQPTAVLREANPHLADGRTLLDNAAMLFGVEGEPAGANDPA